MSSIFTKFIFCVLIICSIVVKGQKLEWAKGFGANLRDEGVSLEVDRYSNVYTVGYFSYTVDFDPGPGVFNLTSPSGENAFLSKLDLNGNFVWAKCFGGTGSANPRDIEIDSIGNIYIIGNFSGSVDFDPNIGNYTLTATGTYSGFVTKLDALGNLIWAKALEGSGTKRIASLIVNSNSEIIYAGNFQGTVDFNPNAPTFNLTSYSSSFEDFFISKLDVNGNFLWAKQFGGIDTDNINSIIEDKHQNIIAIGYFSSTVDFNPNPIDVFNLNSNGQNDVFICKFDLNGDFVWAKNLGGVSSDYGQGLAIDSDGSIYSTGSFIGSVDFDPNAGIYNLNSNGLGDIFISKIDSNGNFNWAKNLGGLGSDGVRSIALDANRNIYTTGIHGSTADFNPNYGVYNLPALGNTNIFLSILDSVGNFNSAFSIGTYYANNGNCITLDTVGNLFITGAFSGTADFDPSQNTLNLSAASSNEDIFICRYSTKYTKGYIYHDLNQNCIMDTSEIGIPNRRAIINPGNLIVETNLSGIWNLDSLPIGNYTITFDTSGNWIPTCSTTMSFNVTNPNGITNTPNFGLISTQPCPNPDVTISAPILRRCFSNQHIYVQACNQNIATGALNSGYVDILLDSLLTPNSASLAYTSLGSNKYRFNIGNLNPGQCSNFMISTTVSCDAMLNQTLCMEAQIFPTDSCVFDTIPATPIPGDTVSVTPCNQPWDNSSLSVDGYCANDTVYFTVTNNGSNMLCNTPVRVFVNDTFIYVYSIILAAGQSITYSYASTGQTWILQADQHPLHPGNSHPNAHVEACGNLSNWTPNLVNNLPLDDADPIKDIYCGIVSGAYDPNDKTGFPTGLGTQHEILPNQQIQYQIRFQNTGNDTAFKIVIRDTLDTDLNIFSVVPGVASHAYSFRMYGPRVLEWTFNNIMLPDSNINEPLSHGFATFRVDQQPNLPNGTTILNDADIYFDFNEPIITNETVHTINNQLHNFAVGVKENLKIQNLKFKIYPNPANEIINIDLVDFDSSTIESNIRIENILGQVVYSSKTKQAKTIIDISKFREGIYIITVENNNKKQSTKVIKL